MVQDEFWSIRAARRWLVTHQLVLHGDPAAPKPDWVGQGVGGAWGPQMETVGWAGSAAGQVHQRRRYHGEEQERSP